MPISLKRKKDISKRKTPFFYFLKAFQISTNYFSLHMHFKARVNPIFFLTSLLGQSLVSKASGIKSASAVRQKSKSDILTPD